MTNHKDDPTQLVRTSVLVTAATDRALRELADRGNRPLSWEVRLALEAHVERAANDVEAAA
jgi:predicted transcriptional regulator